MSVTDTTATARTGTVLADTKKKERPAPVTRTAPHRNAAGHDLGTVDLEPTVFGLEPNRALLHQVITAQLAAARSGTQSTKTRSEVRGGGAKPFRQKGTGRARQGSSRSPSMIGGGVALGPKPRSYAQRTPKKMVRQALLSALSDRAEIGRITVIDDWKIEAPKTKDAATVIRKLRLSGTVLVVVAQDELAVERSFANLPAGADDDLRRALGPRRDPGRLVGLLRPHPAGRSFGLLGHPRGREDDELEAAPAPKARPRPRRPRPRRPKTPAQKAAATRKAKAAAADAEKALEAVEAEAEVELPAADETDDRHRHRHCERGGRNRCVTPCPC